MTKQKGFSFLAIIIVVAFVIVVGAGGYFGYKYYIQFSENKNKQNGQVVVGDRDEHGCIGSAGYSWCEVKQKCLRTWEESCKTATTDQTAGWKTYTEAQLLEMVEKEPWYNEATFFKGLENSFLVLDQGTAPCPRMLIIYDLNKEKEVFTFKYCPPLDIKNNTVSFWWPDDDVQVTVQNCPESVEWTKSGLGAGMESHVLFDLAMLKIKNLGESRCQARQ